MKLIQHFIWLIYRRYTLIVVSLLFILSITLTPVIAYTTTPNAATLDTVQLIDRANRHYQTGDFVAAAQLWQQVAEIFASKKDSLNQAMALSNLSLTYQQLSQWDKAKASINNSLEILSKLAKTKEKQDILAQTLDIQGQLQHKIGQAQNAIATWQQSAQIYRQLNDPIQHQNNLINQAQALQDLGLYPRACKTLLTVLKLDNPSCQISEQQLEEIKQALLQNPNDEVKARALRSLGNILRVNGNIRQSQPVFQVSLAIAQQWGNLQDESKAWLNLGNVERSLARRAEELEDRQKANLYLENAVTAYQKVTLIAQPSLKLQSYLNQLDVFIEQAKWSNAEIVLSNIRTLVTELPPSPIIIDAKINLAKNLVCLELKTSNCFQQKVLEHKGVYTESIQLLKTSAQDAETLGAQRNQSYALGLLGQVYQFQQQWNLAEQYTQEALNLAWQNNAPELIYQWQWQLGRLYKDRGKWQQALSAYGQTVTTLQSIRSDLTSINPEIQFTFREGVEPVYREYVGLLLRNTDQNNLKLARKAIDDLQLGEVENFLRLICLDAYPVSIDQVTDTTDPTAAIIYPILLDDRFEMIVKFPQKANLYHYTTLIEDRKASERTLERLTLLLRQRNSIEAVKLAQQVYNWLIKPLEADLKENIEVKNLVFVLDSSLRNVPMSVLYDGQNYLIEKYGIAITPGLQLLDPRPLKRKSLKVLTAGLSEARKEFSPLDFVPNELKEIQSQVPNSRELLNKAFTAVALQKSLKSGSFSIVHLATHGQFSSQADETFILTWNDRLTVEQLNQLLRSQEPDRKGFIELLILSACETLSGDKRAALGLAGVAIRAGARSTLATLWNVNDEATALLMGQFYEALKQPQITKAEALRMAQLALLNNPRYQRPYYWASYVLVGNWL